ncbi:MAG: sigma 54-interacting transcriptional regulator [Chitinophagaceae bacterium]
MQKKILIVEDQFVEADYLRMMLHSAGYHVCEIARSVAEAIEIVKQEYPDLVILDIFLKGKQTGIDLAQQLKEDNTPFIYLSANSNEEILMAAKATEPDGFLVKPFRQKDLMVALEIAFYRHEQSREANWRTEVKVQKALNAIVGMEAGWIKKLMATASAMQQYLPFDCFSVKFKSLETNRVSCFSFLRAGFDEYQMIGAKELSTIAGVKLEEVEKIFQDKTTEPVAGWYNGTHFTSLLATHPTKALLAKTFGFCSNIVLPFVVPDSYSITLSFFRKVADGYSAEKLHWLFRMQQPLQSVMHNIFEAQKKEAQTIYNTTASIKDIHATTPPFRSIIGNSPALLNVLDMVNQVAASETAVLLLGESGTGKEKIAACIHESSGRGNQPFIKINCAALPPSLIESELFGHEKGAFTGAVEKRMGKFEQADKGTIFLDEIGELPLELQVKLLRVLQEKEVERLGSRYVLKIDTRIIAATNRNLEKEVAEGRFRLDLYYRLNVFPLTLPPLRERKEDIPALTAYFIRHYNQRCGRKITGVSDKVIAKFNSYHWPGNIRELQHIIERGVLLARGTTIEDIQLPVFQQPTGLHVVAQRIKTIEENERDHILHVLKQCNGKIWGVAGAAEILNIPPSTLKSKMKKLGIKKAFME